MINKQAYNNSIPDEFFFYPDKDPQPLIESKQSCCEEESFVYDLVSPDGIHVRQCNRFFPVTHATGIHAPQAFFHFCFAVRSNSIYQLHNSSTPPSGIQHHEYNLFFVPGRQAAAIRSDTGHREVFELNLSRSFLQSYIPGNHPLLERISQTNGEQFLSVSPVALPMTPQLTTILLDIINCPLEQHYKRLFLKAKVIELLSIVFSGITRFEQGRQERNELKENEVRRMQQARAILHDNLRSPCSLIDLAHQVGTNENYLKKHFKKLYGNTVYGYIQDLRMQQAKTMLMQGEPITAIAHSVGYKNVHHFSVAFKKYYGYSPYTIHSGTKGSSATGNQA